jgi:hypothetical protein
MSTLPRPHLPEPSSTPFQRSYWAIPGRLLAGCYPGDLDPSAAGQKRVALLEAGITDFVSLMEANETDHSGDPFIDYWPSLEREAKERRRRVAFHRFPILDGKVPTFDEMRATLAVLDALLAHGRSIYLHCWGGRGRTGTVIASWLIARERLSASAALERLHALIGPKLPSFQPTPETPLQHEFIEQWSIQH